MALPTSIGRVTIQRVPRPNRARARARARVRLFLFFIK